MGVPISGQQVVPMVNPLTENINMDPSGLSRNFFVRTDANTSGSESSVTCSNKGKNVSWESV